MRQPEIRSQQNGRDATGADYPFGTGSTPRRLARSTRQIERSVRGDLVAGGAVLPLLAAAFDAVTAFMSLMDVADPERTLAEVARVLRPGRFVR